MFTRFITKVLLSLWFNQKHKNMKNFLLLSFMALCLVFSGCKKEPDEKPHKNTQLPHFSITFLSSSF